MPFKINTNTVFPIYIPDATQESAGVMSAEDKTKLDGLSPGGGGWTVTDVKTSDYTAAASQVVQVDSSGGAVAITLPDAGSNNGAQIGVKDVGGSLTSIQIVAGEGDNIDGGAVFTFNNPLTGIYLVSNGDQTWMILAIYSVGGG